MTTYTIILTLIVLVILICDGASLLFRKRYSPSDFSKQRITDIEQIMKEPRGVEITDFEERVRRNLLFISLLSIAFCHYGLSIDESSTFFGGLKFNNLQETQIYWSLLFIIGYEAIHYFWIQINNFVHWRIRLTGVSLPQSRGFRIGGQSAGPSDPSIDFEGSDKNTNFYNWMIEHNRNRADSIKSLCNQIDELNALTKEIDIKRLNKETSSISELNSKLHTIDGSVKDLTAKLDNIRLDGSMLRFDQYYRFLNSSQNRRWIILDIFLPLSLSVTAIYKLIYNLFFL